MPDVFVLHVIMDDKLQVRIEGNVIDQKLMAYGLLEVAKEAIKKHHEDLSSGKRIVTAPAAALGSLLGDPSAFKKP